MTVAMTLIVGPEADVLDAHLVFHLNAGVDVVVVAVDDGSTRHVRETLDQYAREGHVRILGEPSSPRSRLEWPPQMARYATTELGADWVIASEVAEFWWPRGGSLGELLSAIPRRYGVVQALVRPFLPVSGSEGAFAERMVYRLAAPALISDLHDRWRPFRKLVHRAPTEDVGRDAAGDGSGLRTLRGWYPIEVLSFPVRSPEQLARSTAHDWAGEDYGSLALDPSALERALAEGVVQLDTRLRDALRSLEAGADLVFPRPTLAENALLGVDAAVLGEGDVLTARRRMDELERRLAGVEASIGVRLERKLRSLIARDRDPE